MACNCGNNLGNSWCPTCLGYPTLMNACTCSDLGPVTQASHVMVQDSQFCPFRLENHVGFLVSRVTGSGQFLIGFSSSPVVGLDSYQMVVNQTFGNLVGVLANGTMNQLLGPATANLILMTNAAGQFIPQALPTAVVPDPLNLTTITVTNLTVANFTLTGTMAATGLPNGTIATTIGLDGSGNVVKGSGAGGVQTAMFFESPSGSSLAVPNEAVIPGGFLIIGNLLYDSGGSIASVQDSQTVKCDAAGKYQIQWFGQIDTLKASRTGMTIQLVINGILVNNANCYPLSPTIPSAADGARTMPISGMECRTLALNDTIKLQLSSSSGSSDVTTYQVRLVLTKIG